MKTIHFICGNEEHVVVLKGGAVCLTAHSPDEVRAAIAGHALGAALPACVEFLCCWRNGDMGPFGLKIVERDTRLGVDAVREKRAERAAWRRTEHDISKLPLAVGSARWPGSRKTWARAAQARVLYRLVKKLYGRAISRVTEVDDAASVGLFPADARAPESIELKVLTGWWRDVYLKGRFAQRGHLILHEVVRPGDGRVRDLRYVLAMTETRQGPQALWADTSDGGWEWVPGQPVIVSDVVAQPRDANVRVFARAVRVEL